MTIVTEGHQQEGAPPVTSKSHPGSNRLDGCYESYYVCNCSLYFLAALARAEYYKELG